MQTIEEKTSNMMIEAQKELPLDEKKTKKKTGCCYCSGCCRTQAKTMLVFTENKNGLFDGKCPNCGWSCYNALGMYQTGCRACPDALE